MRVSIDWEMCIGSGACTEEAPRAFELVTLSGDTDKRAILRGVEPDEAILSAAYACPTLAIHIETDDGREYPRAEGKIHGS